MQRRILSSTSGVRENRENCSSPLRSVVEEIIMIKVTVLLINNKSTRKFTGNNTIKEQKRDIISL